MDILQFASSFTQNSKQKNDSLETSSPVKVGQANGLGESLVHQLLHGLPGLDVVTVHVGRVVALVSQGEHGVLAVVGGVAAIGSQGWILTWRYIF